MNIQTPPPLAFEALEGADRERAERVLNHVVESVRALIDHDGDVDVEGLGLAFAALRADVTESDGEIGVLAFRDALRLVGWLVSRHVVPQTA